MLLGEKWTSQLNRKFVLGSIGLVAATLLSGCSQNLFGFDETKLTLISARHEQEIQPLIDLFESETGIDVTVEYGESYALAEAQVEGKSADIFLTDGLGSLQVLGEAGKLKPIPEATLGSVMEGSKSENGDWVMASAQSTVLAYNPSRIAIYPNSVADLTDPMWQGEIAFAGREPHFQTLLAALSLSGDDASMVWLENMVANGVFLESDADVLAAVEAGQVTAGLVSGDSWGFAKSVAGAQFGVNAMNLGLEASTYVLTGTAVAILSENPSAALFVEFLLGDSAQAYFASTLFEYPILPGVPFPIVVPEGQLATESLLKPNQLLNQAVARQQLLDFGFIEESAE